MFSSWNPFRRSQEEGQQQPQGEEEGIKIVVKFERDRYNIPIPRPSTTSVSTLVSLCYPFNSSGAVMDILGSEEVFNPSTMTISLNRISSDLFDLQLTATSQIQTLSNQIGIPPTQLKLISNGAVLKSSPASIASCGIKNGSTLVVVGANAVPSSGTGEGTGGKEPVQVKKKKEVVPTTDDGLVGYIADKSGVVDELRDQVEQFQRDVDAYLASKSSPGEATANVPTLTAIHQAHMRLSELLLQGLLKLDSIDIPSPFTKSRAARKEAVRKVQNALNIVDGGWKNAKSAHGQGA